MPITNAMCNSFKVELMQALHNFTASTGNTFKLALYTSAATLNASTTTYASTTNEVAASGTYTTGGGTLTNVTPTLSGTTAFTDFFPDLTFTGATITARGALIYNSTNGGRAVCALDFGSDKTSTAGDFVIIFPAATATDAIIRIA